MTFDWDEGKNAANIDKHGVSFILGARIFEGFVLTSPDLRQDYGELREIGIGKVENTVMLAVVHTDRLERRRIISVRPANRRERKEYDKALQSGNEP